MRLGISELSDEGVITIEDQVDVMMSPVLALKLRNLLDDILKRHYPELTKLAENTGVDNAKAQAE